MPLDFDLLFQLLTWLRHHASRDPKLRRELDLYERRLNGIQDRRAFGRSQELIYEYNELTTELDVFIQDKLRLPYTLNQLLNQRDGWPGPLPGPPEHYVLPLHALPILDHVTTNPGYHLITADTEIGKSALIGHLSRDLHGHRERIAASFNAPGGAVSLQSVAGDLIRQLSALADSKKKEHHPGLLAATSDKNTDLNGWLLHASELLDEGRISRKTPIVHLLVLIDGLDRCSPEDYVLIGRTFPSRLPPNISVVLTAHLGVLKHLDTVLPSEHALKTALHGQPPKHLMPLGQGDISRLLAEHFGLYNERLSQLIFGLSEGHPWRVLRCCQAVCDYLRINRDPVKEIEQQTKWDLFEVYFQNWLQRVSSEIPDPATTELFRHLLAHFVVAGQDTLPLVELAEQLGVAPSELADLQRILYRHLSIEGDTVVLKQADLVGLLRERDEWRAIISSVEQRVIAYRRQEAAVVATYLGTVTPPPQPVGRPDSWSSLLKQRATSYASWVRAITETWDDLDNLLRSDGVASPEELAVETVALALLRMSAPRTVLPELIVAIVRKGLWSKDEAQRYSQLYRLREDKAFVEHALASDQRNSAPPPLLSAEEEQQLQAIKRQRIAKRPAAVERWLDQTMARLAPWPSEDDAICGVFIEALHGGDDDRGPAGPAPDLDELLRLAGIAEGGHPPAQAAGLSPDWVERVAQAWADSSQAPGPTLSRILRAFCNRLRNHPSDMVVIAQRRSLLEALTVLAPEIARRFPGAVEPIARAARHIVAELP